jgi:hypothetical protein
MASTSASTTLTQWIHDIGWLEVSGRDFVQHRRKQDEILAANQHHVCFASAREGFVEVHCQNAGVVIMPDVPGDHVPPVSRQRSVDDDPISGSKPRYVDWSAS